jgi:hypothetical protein
MQLEHLAIAETVLTQRDLDVGRLRAGLDNGVVRVRLDRVTYPLELGLGFEYG